MYASKHTEKGIRCESVTVTLLCGGRKLMMPLEGILWEGERVGGNRVRISAVIYR